MFDKLLEILQTIWKDLMPYYVVNEMELSCVLRLGKYLRVSKPGIHGKIPFADVPFTYHVKTCTVHMPSQSLTTIDNKDIVIKAIARYHIYDIKKYTLEVWSAQDAMNDTIQGIIATLVKQSTWSDLHKGFEDEIARQSADILNKWGITVEKITLSDLSPLRSFRLIR
jgi:regulator of protease activity HflC (stomatin/prohibitin superfamily)